MEPDRGGKNSLAAEEPSEPQENFTLPAIAAKADDLEEIKKSVEDAAAVSGGLWLSYLFVLSYIAMFYPPSRSRRAPSPMKIFCWCAPSDCPSSMSNCR